MSTEKNDSFEFEYLEDGQILCYTIYSLKRDVIDAYIESIKTEIYEKKQNGDLFLGLFDFGQAGNLLTPYFLTRMRALKDVFADKSFHGRAALVAPLGVFRHLFNSIISVFTAIMPEIEVRFFATRAEGVEWVLQYLHEAKVDQK